MFSLYAALIKGGLLRCFRTVCRWTSTWIKLPNRARPNIRTCKALSVPDRTNTEITGLYPVWDMEPLKYTKCKIIPYLRHWCLPVLLSIAGSWFVIQEIYLSGFEICTPLIASAGPQKILSHIFLATEIFRLPGFKIWSLLPLGWISIEIWYLYHVWTKVISSCSLPQFAVDVTSFFTSRGRCFCVSKEMQLRVFVKC